MYNTTALSGGGTGGSNTSENGYKGSLWGAGGGGGTVRFVQSGSSTNVYKGKGGDGANGIAEITYDIMYPAAGGGGGGGGALLNIKNLSVSPGSTYKVRVSGGGTGGSVGASGSDGGTSSLTVNGSIYSLSGGKGGIVGTSQTATTSVIQGVGGEKGIFSTSVTDMSNLKYKNGSNGSDGGEIVATVDNPYGGSYGGNGGTSGIDTKGGCGGMFLESSICTNTGVNGTYTDFVSPGNLFSATEYGNAGAGGAGGGWSENTRFYPNPGGGANGQDGYVYIYWTVN